jgi:hypothetical protein
VVLEGPNNSSVLFDESTMAKHGVYIPGRQAGGRAKNNRSPRGLLLVSSESDGMESMLGIEPMQ